MKNTIHKVKAAIDKKADYYTQEQDSENALNFTYKNSSRNKGAKGYIFSLKNKLKVIVAKHDYNSAYLKKKLRNELNLSIVVNSVEHHFSSGEIITREFNNLGRGDIGTTITFNAGLKYITDTIDCDEDGYPRNAKATLLSIDDDPCAGGYGGTIRRFLIH